MPEKKDSKQPVKLTREELYRQVWEIPMSRLAKEYGLSDTGLAKICRRLDVPYPPRGHWAKKVAGKKVDSSTLPAPRADTPEQITITPTAEPTPVAVPSPAMKSSMDPVRASLEISVPDRLLRPHKVVAGWIADYERRVQEARRQRDPWAQKHWKPTPFGDLDRRRHRILDALFKELERKGGAVGENDRKELYVEVNGERIEFQLRQKQKQVRRPLTEDEKKRSWNANRETTKELQPTGKFVLAIKTYLPGGLRSEWLENDSAPLEALLPDIVATIVAAGPLLEERTRQHKEAERRRQIAEVERYEEQQRRKLERNRWRRFLAYAKAWQDAKLAQEFVAALKPMMGSGESVGGRTVPEWISWAEAKIKEADPTTLGVEAIFDVVWKIESWSYSD